MFETLRQPLTSLSPLASFGNDALIISETGGRPGRIPSPPVAIRFREHPELFAQPRFLVADIDQGTALVRKAICRLAKGRLPWIAPQIVVRIERAIPGGATKAGRKMPGEVFINTGVRKVVWLNP